MTTTPLERSKIERRPNKRGFRWYGVYRVPPTGDTVRIRLYALPTDVTARITSAPFPPGDPDYKRLYGRRPDTESINSVLVRCSGQWGRAHSYGWRRQFLDLVGFALLVNAGAAASFERCTAAGRPPDAATPLATSRSRFRVSQDWGAPVLPPGLCLRRLLGRRDRCNRPGPAADGPLPGFPRPRGITPH